MENPNILDLEYYVFSKIQNILENRSTMESFLEVLPPDCTSEDILMSMEIESRKYNMTPAKTLLTFLGSKGFRASDLIKWFQAMGLEKALRVLKHDEALMIVSHPQNEVKVNENSELILSCSAVSYPPPEYQWYKDDVEILLQIDPILSIKPARVEDSGTYVCLVTKWNSQKNAYEWLYSDCSYVEVIPVDLHAIPSCYQEPHNYIDIPQHLVLSEKDILTIIKHPYVDGKVAQGMSICLNCEGVNISNTVNYQWFKNRRPLQGETLPQLILNDLHPDPDTGEQKWEYQCEVYNEFDRILSHIAVVELDEINDTTPYIAHQKHAFLIANDTYEYLEHLQKPAADVKDIANMLSSLGFKIFAFRNLNLTEMRNAFTFFCETIVPGSYALFFFAGHGFELYGQTYLQPVDSSNNFELLESMCSEYILQCMQEKNPALNILLIDACRKMPPNFSKNPISEYPILPGRIFQAKMKRNTIYGYSTSFLCASHENDEETNSLFVKHLKKHITQNKCIQDILMMVQVDFAKDPIARTVQFPAIKSTLAEKRKLNDPIQKASTSVTKSHIVDWCDLKREKVSRSIEISKIKATIIIEYHHHMEVFCNGIDVFVYLYLKPDAEMFILQDMEINISFTSPLLDVVPENGVVLKNTDLLTGRKNLLIKKEVFNLHKLNTEDLNYNISLKFSSKNITQNIESHMKFIKISELKLSLNHLAANNVEEPLLNQNALSTKNLLEF